MKYFFFLAAGIFLAFAKLNFLDAYTDQDFTIKKVPTQCEIVEFSVYPAGVVAGINKPGQKMTFKWNVKQGPESGLKVSINLSKTQGKGPVLNFTTAELKGQYSIDIPAEMPEGKTVYTISVNSEQYTTNMATVIFEAKALEFALDDIEVNGVEMGDVSGSVPEDSVFDLFVTVNNRSNVDIPDMLLKVLICKPGGSCSDNPFSYTEVPLTILKGNRNYRIPLKLPSLADPGWSSLRIKLLSSQTNILLHVWEFPLKNDYKKVYSLM